MVMEMANFSNVTLIYHHLQGPFYCDLRITNSENDYVNEQLPYGRYVSVNIQ